MGFKKILIPVIGIIFICTLDGYCKEAAQPQIQGTADKKAPAEEEKKEPPKVVIKVNGKKIKKKEIEQEIKELKKRLKKNKTTLEDTLKKNRLTMEALEKELEKNLSISKLNINKNKEFKANAAKKVTETYLEEHYNNNKEKFKEPERTRLREILIRADPSGGQKVWEEARVRSEEILKE